MRTVIDDEIRKKPEDFLEALFAIGPHFQPPRPREAVLRPQRRGGE